MKKILLLPTVLAAACSLYFVAPVLAQVAPEKGKVNVELGSAVPIELVVKTLQGRSFDEAIAQGSFTANGQTSQDFVTITPGQTASDVARNWTNGRSVLIAQLTKDGYFGKDTLLTSNTSTDGSAAFAVKGLTVYGEKQSVISTADQFTGKHSGFQSSNNNGSNNTSKAHSVSPINGAVKALAVANTPYYTLLPISGSITTGLFTAPGVTNPTRGVANYMGWSSNKFASDQTYEHDFFLDAAGGTYFAKSFSNPPYCQPKTLYAATSWPAASYPYLDSDLESNGFCTSSGNIAYTIGAGQANAITAGVSHYTYLLMPNGDAATDTFLVQGQVGYQLPVGCHDVLCSFGYGYASGYKETTHYGLKSGTVPGTQTWTTPGFVPDVPAKVSVSNPSASSLRLNFVDITWDETNISAERSVGSSGPWAVFNFGVLNAGNSAGNWYWDNSGLSSHTQYCYRMRSTNAIGSSAYSPITCGTTL